MSEEIKSLKEYISTTKNEIFTTFKIETISNLIIYYEDLQQKVEQLENIRKEAIEYINHATIGADSSPIEDSWLYDLYETKHILSKGDNKYECNRNV